MSCLAECRQFRTGKWLSKASALDQNDFWLSEKVEKSLEKLKKEDADCVFGDLEVVDQDLKTMYPSFNDYMLLSRRINKYIHDSDCDLQILPQDFLTT